MPTSRGEPTMRRFFRFTIRDLLWLTLVVAMGLGWLATYWGMDQRFQREISAERKRTLYWQLSAIAGGETPNNAQAGIKTKTAIKAGTPTQPTPKNSN